MKKLIIAAAIIMLTLTSTVSAQTIGGPNSQPALGVDKSIIESVVDPGVAQTQEIRLTNLTNFPLPIKASKESFTPREKLDIPQDQLGIYDASSWITLADEDTDFIIQPKEIKTIQVTVTQPQNASPGGHYASLYFEPLIPESVVSDQSVFVYARVAVLFFLQVKGQIVENIGIKQVSAPGISDSTPVTISTILQNTGNTHILPAGKIEVTDELTHSIVQTIPFPQTIVLPGTEKNYAADFTSNAKIGVFSAQVIVNYGASNLALTSQKIEFYVFPYNFVLIIIIPLLIACFFIIRYRKRFRKAIRVLTTTQSVKKLKFKYED